MKSIGREMSRRRMLGWIGSAAGGARAVAAAAGALQVRVVLDETGETVPCSVALRDSSGALAIENRSYTDGFRSSGAFRKELPAGPAQLTVTRGFDFAAEQRDVTIREGQTTELEIRLLRRSPLSRSGWLCGDHHVHMTHGESRIRVDFDYIALAARAEGLDHLSVGQFWNLPKATATAAEAECRRVSTADCSLSWNLEAPKNYYRGNASTCLGHCWFTGARASESIAEELLGLSAHDYEVEKTPAPNFESHALIHQLGGVISYTHPCRWWWGQWGGRGGYPLEERKFVSNLAAELPFDTIAGPTFDGLDILMQTHEKQANAQAQQLWFLLLNHGYRPRATASSDATFDNEGRGTPGRVRLYTRVQGDRSIGAVAGAIRRGNSFVTSGPLLSFEVDGRHPGETVVSDGPARRVARVRAWASGLPGETLREIQLVRNGEVMRTMPVLQGQQEFAVEHAWTEEGGAWVLARCFGKDRDTQVAITNPIFFDPPGWKPPAPAQAKIRIRVADARTGQPVAAACDALERTGRQDRSLFRREAPGGVVELEAPATARLRVEAPGYKPAFRSIFLDHEPILRATLEMRAERLLEWSTYERLREALSRVEFDVRLERA
jgi:TolB protein